MVPWEQCTVSFLVDYIEGAQDINICPELPDGWRLHHSERVGIGHRLVFHVQDEPTDRDGHTVLHILDRLRLGPR